MNISRRVSQLSIFIQFGRRNPCIEPLKKYGNAILINENKDFDIHLLLNFLDTHDRKVFDEFVSNFESSTPSYTANLISNI